MKLVHLNNKGGIRYRFESEVEHAFAQFEEGIGVWRIQDICATYKHVHGKKCYRKFYKGVNEKHCSQLLLFPLIIIFVSFFMHVAAFFFGVWVLLIIQYFFYSPIFLCYNNEKHGIPLKYLSNIDIFDEDWNYFHDYLISIIDVVIVD